MDKEFVGRIKKLVEKVGGQSALARKMDLSHGAIQRYLRGGEPTRQVLIRMCEAADVSMNWLVYGIEDQKDGGVSDLERKQPVQLPMYGFGDSANQDGWYSEVNYRITTTMDMPDPEAFAIVAADNLMSLKGIREGDVCTISPNTPCRSGDIVLIRRKDGTASLKVYIREDADWIYTKGYLDSGDNGKIVSAYDQVKKSVVKQVGVVFGIRKR